MFNAPNLQAAIRYLNHPTPRGQKQSRLLQVGSRPAHAIIKNKLTATRKQIATLGVG